MLGVTHKSQLSQQKLVGSLKRICGYLGLNWEEWASTTTDCNNVPVPDTGLAV